MMEWVIIGILTVIAMVYLKCHAIQQSKIGAVSTGVIRDARLAVSNVRVDGRAL